MKRKPTRKKAETSYGYWKVLEELPDKFYPSGQYKRVVSCECVCGNIRTITLDTLRRGITTNCGCVSRKDSKFFHAESGSRLYMCWQNMKGRCRDRDDCDYYSDWETFLPFKAWALSSGYTEESILLRGTKENPDQGDYTPDNCRWGDKRQNYLDYLKASSK